MAVIVLNCHQYGRTHATGNVQQTHKLHAAIPFQVNKLVLHHDFPINV